MYKVIRTFTDLRDKGYMYRAGDVFPRSGMVASEKRLIELSGSNNKRGVPLIKKVEELNPKEVVSEVKENVPKEEVDIKSPKEEKAKKKPRKGQEKNARTDS